MKVIFNLLPIAFCILTSLAQCLSNAINEYFSISRQNKLSSNNNKNNLFTVHINTRSLLKNHDKIKEFLSELNVLPEIISISETKLNSRSTSNVNIAQYDFLHNNSPSKAGDVGLYVKNNVKYSLSNDLNLHLSNCEDTWIEICSKSKSIILSTIYRHPTSNITEFHKKLGDTLIILENSTANYIINGDVNINLLNPNNSKVKQYIDMLNSTGSCSLLTSPTRFFSNCTPSLLDHIYSNMSNHPKTSGICLYDISDHLPTFLMIETLKHPALKKPSYKRSMKNFDIENFLVDLHKHVETINVFNPNTSVNSNATSLSSVFELALNKHAPLRPMSRREKRLSQKPWTSKGILKSFKTKNKLFKTRYGSNDSEKKLFYKQFLNKLTDIKSLAK